MSLLDTMTDDPLTENSNFVERLAELEYQQWCQTVRSLLPDLDNRAHWERRIAIPYRALTPAEKPRYWLWARNVQQLIQDMREEHKQQPANWLDTLLAPSWSKAVLAVVMFLLGIACGIWIIIDTPQLFGQWVCW